MHHRVPVQSMQRLHLAWLVPLGPLSLRSLQGALLVVLAGDRAPPLLMQMAQLPLIRQPLAVF